MGDKKVWCVQHKPQQSAPMVQTPALPRPIAAPPRPTPSPPSKEPTAEPTPKPTEAATEEGKKAMKPPPVKVSVPCAEMYVMWSPLDGPKPAVQVKSMEECQEQCAAIDGCAHFSYYK